MKQYKFIALAIVFLSAFSLNAQQKLEKLSKTVKANKDVILRLDTNQTNIEIDTWDKNEIQVEAFIESSELSKIEVTPETQELFNGYLERLEELNNEYAKLADELTESGPTERTVNALIDNLKLRLNLLYRLKEKLNELNNDTNKLEQIQA